MAGYSGTPLAKKLGLRDGARAYLVNVPAELTAVFSALDRKTRLAPPLDYIHVFETDVNKLTALFPRIAMALHDEGMVWMSWPKKASKRPTTVDEGKVRELGLDAGLVDVKICAVDDVWSGLKFVRRLVDRGRDKNRS
jgi:hypothetical protein